MTTETDKQNIFPSRILHTMLRVSDIKKSEHFYCQFLGMILQRKKDYPDGKFTLAFLGYGDESNNTVLELTHNWSEQTYTKGNAYGHIALAVNNIYKTCQYLEHQGVEISRQPGPMKADASEVIAFIKDPDGYQIELIEII
jgi:lactoylglutathione lyase